MSGRNRRWSPGPLAIGIGLLVALAWIAPEMRNRLDEKRNLSYREDAERAVNLSDRYASDKRYVLELINTARLAEGLVPVSLGDNPAAQGHAEALRDACVLSHWGPDGLKPYARYSMAGGYQANSENASGPVACDPSDAYDDIREGLRDSMEGLMESPGHRANILNPLHRRVNIGIALDRGVWLVQHFEGDYITYERLPTLNNGSLSLTGHLRNGTGMEEHGNIHITYDPPPHELTRGQLFHTYCYGHGDTVAVILRDPFPGRFAPQKAELLDSIELEDVTRTSCPDPYGVDADVFIPSSTDGIERTQAELRSVVMETVPPDPIFLLSEMWALSDGNAAFDIRADIRKVIEMYGPGLYTVEVLGTLEGSPGVVSSYTLWLR